MVDFRIRVDITSYPFWDNYDIDENKQISRRELDLYDNETIDITYNINDIADYSNARTSFSQTIKLPDTNENRRTFGLISDLTIDHSIYAGYYFNVNKKSKCWVISESMVVLEGYIQLTKVNFDHNSNETSFECVIYAETANFFGSLEDYNIDILNFSALNHIWKKENIIATWAPGQGSGYYYPLIDYGNGWQYNDINPPVTLGNVVGVRTAQMNPAIYAKVIWDRIFQATAELAEDGIGFSYQSNFLNSDRFKNLIIPFNGDKLMDIPSYYDSQGNYLMGIDERTSFRVGLLNSIGVGGIPTFFPVNFGGFFVGQYTAGSQSFNGTGRFDDMGWNSGNTQSYYDNGHTYPIGSPYGDYWVNNNYYYRNTYTQSGTSTFKQRFCFDFKIGTFHPSNPETNRLNGFATASVNITQFNNPNNGKQENDVMGALFGSKIVVQICRENNPYTGQQDPNWNSGGGYPIQGENGELWWTIHDSLDGSAISDNINLQESTYQLTVWNHLSDRYTGLIKTAYLDNSHPTLRPIMPNERVRVVTRFRTKWGGGPDGHLIFSTSGQGVGNPFFTPPFIPSAYFGTGGLMSVPQNLIIIGPNSNHGVDGSSRFYNETSLELVPGGNGEEGSYISYGELVPKNWKMKDYMRSIIQMFNLFIEPSKDNPKLLLIEPRDDYYASGEQKDWSEKLDYSKDIEVDMIVQKQSKSNKFNWKEDKDWHNTNYKQNFNRTFGDFDYIVDNDFINGEKAISSLFSPTIIDNPKGSNYAINRTAEEFLIPVIAKELTGSMAVPSGKIASNFRILQRKTAGYKSLTANTFRFETVPYNYYPYAGNVDDPLDPDFDLDWGSPLYVYYKNDNYTNKNLFSVYWKSTLEELTDINAKMITVSLYLTPKDIANFKFNDRILLTFHSQQMGSGTEAFRVNKITGYDPSKPKPCKVELLRIVRSAMGTNVITAHTGLPDVIYPPGPLNGNMVSSNNVLMVGSSNIVGSMGVVSGNNNVINSGVSNLMVSGNNNNVLNGSSNVMLMGNNITVNEGIQNAFVIGNDITVSQSNMVIVSQPVIQYFNIVDGGENEVINEFGSINVNIIDGSNNRVRELGSSLPIHIIQGGNNQV